MGARKTKDFYRLYMIPGMFHCRGVVGCDDADWLTPLVNWGGARRCAWRDE